MSFSESLPVMSADRGRENGRGHANGLSRHREAERPHAHIDGACAQRGDIKYGLNYGGDAPDDDARCAIACQCVKLLRGKKALLYSPDANTHTQHGACCRRERRTATQRNLEEAAKRKAEEEREKAAQRYVRKEYK